MTSINYTINTKIHKKIYGIAGALLTLAVPFFLMLGNGDHHLETHQSLCPFKMLTGFPCPGCGITKSLVYFYQGDLYKSFCYHLFGPFVIAFSVATVLVLSTELITKKEYFNGILFNKKLAYFLGFTLAVYHIIRLVYFVYWNDFDGILRQSVWK